MLCTYIEKLSLKTKLQCDFEITCNLHSSTFRKGFQIAFIAAALKLIGSSALLPDLQRGTCRKFASKINFKKVFKELLTGAH